MMYRHDTYLRILIVLLFCGMGSVGTLYAQDHARDQDPAASLRKKIKAAENDSIRAKLFVQLSMLQASIGQLDSAEATARQGLKLSLRIKYATGIVKNRVRLGDLYMERGSFDAAAPLLRKAYQQSKKTGDWSARSDALSAMGKWHQLQGRLDSARYYHQHAAIVCQENNDPVNAANSWINVGNTYLFDGRLPQALTTLLRADELLRNEGSAADRGYSRLNLGALLGFMDDHKKALDYFMRAAEAFDSCQCDLPSLALSRFNAGLSLFFLNDTLEAMHQMRKALYHAREAGDNRTTSLACATLGDVFMDRNQLDSARHYQQAALRFAQKSMDLQRLSGAYRLTAELLIREGDSKAASEPALKALDYARESSDVNELANAHNLLYRIDSMKGDFLSALKHYQKYHMFSDSLTGQEQAREMGRIEARYEAEERIKDLTEESKKQDEQITKRNWALAGMALGVLFLVWMGYSMFRSRQKLSEANNRLQHLNSFIVRQKHEIEVRNSELDKAHQKLIELDHTKEELAAMVVHDLKNPLSAIMLLSDLPPDSHRLNYIHRAGREMEDLINNLMAVQKYETAALPIEPQPIELDILVDETLESMIPLFDERKMTYIKTGHAWESVSIDPRLAHRMIYNILNNALKYAPTGDEIVLHTRYATQANHVELSVTDHGPGIPEEQLDSIFDKYSQVQGRQMGRVHSLGLGLTFCRMVAEAHGCQIWAESELNHSTTIRFTLPLAQASGQMAAETGQLNR